MFETVIDVYTAKHLGCVVVSTAATAAADDPDVAHSLAHFIEVFDNAAEAWLSAGGDSKAKAHAKLLTAHGPQHERPRPRRCLTRYPREHGQKAIIELVF